jgi:hypothetical protein
MFISPASNARPTLNDTPPRMQKTWPMSMKPSKTRRASNRSITNSPRVQSHHGKVVPVLRNPFRLLEIGRYCGSQARFPGAPLCEAQLPRLPMILE